MSAVPPPVTKAVVACTCRLLDRAVLFLRPRVADPEAEKLLHDARNVLSGGNFLVSDVDLPRWQEHADALNHRAKSILAGVRAFAEANSLRFLVVESPRPWSVDTEPALDTREIVAAIAEMAPGATEPPSPVREAIAEAQRLDLPAPSETELPASENEEEDSGA